MTDVRATPWQPPEQPPWQVAPPLAPKPPEVAPAVVRSARSAAESTRSINATERSALLLLLGVVALCIIGIDFDRLLRRRGHG